MALLPIVTYNDSVLREKTAPITNDYPNLKQLISDMFETMYNSHGVGLAAPQIGLGIQLFVINADPMMEDDEPKHGEMVFINPKITKMGDQKIPMEEGCLSIPDVRDKVFRPNEITITYLDKDFNELILNADGWLSRVVQHEYDHLQGVLFIDYLGSFRKRLVQSALDDIEKGTYPVDYPIVPKK
ncbi:peptide deformylase [bacterium]|nr:MAG: peptide deformylase [bacterium]